MATSSCLLTFTSFMIIFLEMGSLKSFGVLFNPMMDSLECSAAEVGTVIGMSNSIGYIIAPITGNLARRYGSRVCVTTGGCLLFVGYLASVFTWNIFQLTITLGLTTGVGMGLTYIPQIVALVSSPSKHFPVMYAIVFLGGSFGVMAFPPVVDFLLGIYGWRGTLMIMSAVMFHVSVFGALNGQHVHKYSKLNTTDTDQVSNDKNEPGFRNRLKEVASWLSLNILAEKPTLLLQLGISLLQGVSSAAWMVFLVPHAVSRGITLSAAALLSTGGGVGNLVGRLLNIPLQGYNVISAFWFFVLLCLINSVAMFMDSFAHDNYVVLMFLACVNGGAIGLLNILWMLVVKEMYDESFFVDFYILSVCMYGLGEISGSFATGLLYDLTRSYDLAFVGLGIVNIVMMVLMLVDGVIQRCCSHH
ncbi:monocarboxylate transporter 7-like [Asterias rubens]|uniref:monocarboxylate transporter 7-like n=1 Tax=Asterias rubens TaxID=7604 RepID=UPI001454FC2A|nr:monocarboxylate transporter 7-like [Asterias rubens]XP_033644638.1 monocarboxylate transporter 7-like [Asterias rubens]